MEKFIVSGGVPLAGDLYVGGAKNVALKLCVTALLTDEEVILHNVPNIGDVHRMLEVLKSLGVAVSLELDTVKLRSAQTMGTSVSLGVGGRLRTSAMVLGPLLARYGEAKIPNPGGCRLGARPIDRHIQGLEKMGAKIEYNSDDGYFYAKAQDLHGAVFSFPKNTHTGTESLMLAAVLAHGTTVLHNAAEEVEIDDLIRCLNAMGANIKRTKQREITIIGVDKLHGVEFTVMPDRNEEVTFAIAAAATGGRLRVHNSQLSCIPAFIEKFTESGGIYSKIDSSVTEYRASGNLTAVDVATGPYPGFMTDWQAPWALLMTQARGASTIHETVFESRFSYVSELKKIGAHIDFFDPAVQDPETFYNFNWEDRVEGYHQGIRITGPTKLHNAILEMDDLRAGATLLLASLVASGESVIYGVEQIDRGYEKIEERLKKVGAKILRIKEEI